jgi:hypothetical protein
MTPCATRHRRDDRAGRWLAGAVAAAALVGSLPSAAHAWSFETHLFIASQVLDDVLDDGMISLCVGAAKATSRVDCSRRYRVPADVLEGMRSDRGAAYLAGSLGPDVYPDIVTGQMTVHPGLQAKGGWPTFAWLDHILGQARSPPEVAFAYGVAGHAAGDIFAHTYVNQYAGGIFLLSEHAAGRNEVEARHYLLERYIAQRTPRTWERYGGPRGLKAPSGFVVDALLLDPGVGGQYRLEPATWHALKLYERYSAARRDAEIARAEGPPSASLVDAFEAEAAFYRAGASELVAASEHTAHELVDPSPERTLFGASGASASYIAWAKCWGPILKMGAKKATRAICRGFSWYADVEARADGWAQRQLPRTYSGALAVRRFGDDLSGTLREALVRTVHPDAARVLRALRVKAAVTDEQLNTVYSRDQSRKGLLPLPDVAGMVRGDAGLGDDGETIDPARFAPLFDSIVLAKLALLDQGAINEVVAAYAPEVGSLYTAPYKARHTLVAEGVRSIDGNHQWQPKELPYPRVSGLDPRWPRCFGSPGAAGEDSAFRLWGHPVAREKVFLAIFKGPLSPALEEILKTLNYPFPASAETPFPSTAGAPSPPCA